MNARLSTMVAVGVGTLALTLAGLTRSTSPATFVGKERCASCHREEAARYRASHHDRALEVASPHTISGDFTDRQVSTLGVTSTFRRDGERSIVHTEGADGGLQDFEVVATLGVAPLQQYLVELEPGRRQVLRLAWDTEQRRWFDVRPADVTEERLAPDDPLHWTQLAQNWNTSCADCHSTAVRKGFDSSTQHYATTSAEEDVGCEACHGAGSRHAAVPSFVPAFLRPTLALGRGVDQRTEVETCGTCHSRRSQHREGFRPGEPLLDSYEPAPLAVDLYRPDGKLLDEVFEYGSFLQSKMYSRHVRCSDCHEPHGATLKFEGNALCTQCHEATKFDSERHHHHGAGSPGASCVDCHMGTETYLGIDRRHDHGFRVPRPLAEASVGSPSVCAQCHREPDRGAEWAQRAIDGWTGHAPQLHWSTTLAEARKKHDVETLTRLAADEQLPVIARVTALGATAGVPAAFPTQLSLSTHEDPWLRLWALRVLPVEVEDGELAVARGLADPIRAVRLAAIEQAWRLPDERRARLEATSLRRAAAEYLEAAVLNSDRAAGWLSRSLHAQGEKDVAKAIAAAREAVRIEPTLSGPRAELAALLDEAGARDEARRVRVEEAELLERDARRSADPAANHRLGLLRVLLGEWEKAEVALQRACDVPAGADEACYALALTQERRCGAEGASCERFRQTVSRFERLAPGDARTRELTARLSRGTQVGPGSSR